MNREQHFYLYPDSLKTRILLAKRRKWDSSGGMIRGGFLSVEDRMDLKAMARDGSSTARIARRANAIVLLDPGWSCTQVADALLLDDDKVRTWHGLFVVYGVDGLATFDAGGSACRMSAQQQAYLTRWITQALPRSTRQIGGLIEARFDLTYESRSGLIAVLRRLGFRYQKPEFIPRKLDEAAQSAFIKGYRDLLKALPIDEAVLFADAIHQTHAAKPAGCWGPIGETLAIGQQRINIRGAIDLETGQIRIFEVLTADAESTIRLLEAIEALCPFMALIHVYFDKARCHHAKLVRAWLTRSGCRIKLHFLPAYCPHLNVLLSEVEGPIERLWGLMHKQVTHNKTYPNCAKFAKAVLGFLRQNVPRNWQSFSITVTDNFRVISPMNFRILA
jgi:transposase